MESLVLADRLQPSLNLEGVHATQSTDWYEATVTTLAANDG